MEPITDNPVCKYSPKCEGFHVANVTCHEDVACNYCGLYRQFEKQIHEIKGFK